MSRIRKITIRNDEYDEAVRLARNSCRLASTILKTSGNSSDLVPSLWRGWHQVKRALEMVPGVSRNESDVELSSERIPLPSEPSKEIHQELEKAVELYKAGEKTRLSRLTVTLHLYKMKRAVAKLSRFQRLVPRPAKQRRTSLVRTWVPVVTLIAMGIVATFLVIRNERPSEANGLVGTYFADTQFRDKKAVRIDRRFHFNWNKGSPMSGIPPDHFSARWEGFVYIKPGESKRFFLGSDDGAKLFINGELVVDNGGRHNYRKKTAKKKIGPGRHRIVIEYVELSGAARLNLQWNSENGYWSHIPIQRLFHDT